MSCCTSTIIYVVADGYVINYNILVILNNIMFRTLHFLKELYLFLTCMYTIFLKCHSHNYYPRVLNRNTYVVNMYICLMQYKIKSEANADGAA